MIMEETFDYIEAVRELERIVAKVEDPSTGLDDIDKYITRSDELIDKCRNYLRSAREKVEKL